VLALEGAYVFPDLLGDLPQRAILLFVGGLDPGDVAGIEDRRERLHFLERFAYGVQVLFFEDAGEGGSVVGIVGKGILTSEHKDLHPS
jgi:hypothetical protein